MNGFPLMWLAHQFITVHREKPKYFLISTTSGFVLICSRMLGRPSNIPTDERSTECGKSERNCTRKNWVIKREKADGKVSVPR